MTKRKIIEAERGKVMLSNEHRLEEAAFCQEADEDVSLGLSTATRKQT